jgi:hypothetical protein
LSVSIGFDDRNLLNQCLLYNYVISYEPYNFTGIPSDYPDTVNYGNSIDALRTELREWFWDGTFRGRALIGVDSDSESIHHAVYEAADGSLGVVVVNYSETPSSPIVLRAADGTEFDGSVKIVGDDVWSSGAIVIPARSAMVAVPAGRS